MPQTILLTGASGFIAAHILHTFLKAGYHVRATVRSESSAEKVKKTHGEYGDKLKFVTVPDITADGAFDKAVVGVDGILHTASPFVLNATDFEKDLFQPALHGTLSVLRSAAKESRVKRVIILSSFSSIIDYKAGVRPGYVYTEKDWNPMTPKEAEDPTSAYNVSKVIAEKAAWDFVRDHKPGFSVTSINPPMVYGPIAHAISSMSHLNTSSADFYRLINGTEKDVPGTEFFAYVDVRDLAENIKVAYESEEGAGERYAVTEGGFTYQMFVDIVREEFEELRSKVPEGKKGEGMPGVYRLSNEKGKGIGMGYRSMRDCVVDSVKSLLALEKELGA